MSFQLIEAHDLELATNLQPEPAGASDTTEQSADQQVVSRSLTKSEKSILYMINECLVNWHKPWRESFLTGGREFRFVYDLMEGLFYYEDQVLTSSLTLSTDRTNAIAQAVARLADCGNAVLNLDLVVRSDDGMSAEIESSSVTTIELFKAHLKAHDLRRKLLYDYYKKEDVRNQSEPNAFTDEILGSNPNTLNGLQLSTNSSSSTLLVPLLQQARGMSPALDRPSILALGSSSSINSMQDGNKSPSGSQGPQIEVLTPTYLNSQLEVTHMTASVRSSSFSSKCDSKARIRILTEILARVENFLSSPPTADKIANCFELLDALLDSIEKIPLELRCREVELISTRLLEPIVKKVYIDDRDDQIELQHAHWTTHLLSIIRLMRSSDFNAYMKHFPTSADLSGFLKDYLFIVRRLSSVKTTKASSPLVAPMESDFFKSSGPTYPPYWIEMILLASSTFLNSLTHIYHILRQQFGSNTKMWSGYIDCLLNFIRQDALQPGRFMLKKRLSIQATNLRQTAAEYVEAAWSSLSINQKQQLFEDVIEPLLHVCVILPSQQRSMLLPILYDMMRCDYTSQYIAPRTSACGSSSSTLIHPDNYNNSQEFLRDDDLESLPPLDQTSLAAGYAKNTGDSIAYLSYQGSSDDGTVLTKFTHVVIGHLNELMIELNLGDECFKLDLCNSLSGKFGPNSSAHNPNSFDSHQFKIMARHTSDLVAEFMQICLDIHQANRASYMHLYLLCLFKLVLFFRDKVDRSELYLSNLYKLCVLHHESGRYLEAGYTLYEHARSLPWSDRPIDNHLRLVSRFFNLQGPLSDYSSLKVSLYNMMIDYFDQGQLWEAAVPLCRELLNYYEFTTYEYDKLVRMHRKMSDFYSNIIELGSRSNPEYFRVTFFGNGFPESLRSETLVYRGQPFEKLSDFQANMLTNYPGSKLLNSLAKPDESIVMDPEARYLQINACSPLVDLSSKFGSKLSNISEYILNYYRYNQCDKFTFSRRTSKPAKFAALEDKSDEDSFANIWRERTTLTTNTLPGMLPFFTAFLIESKVVSPIENAIEDLERTNDRLSSMVNRFRSDKRQAEDIRSLGQLLLGIVDAAVNGGITKYERAFFTPTSPANCARLVAPNRVDLANIPASSTETLDQKQHVTKNRGSIESHHLIDHNSSASDRDADDEEDDCDVDEGTKREALDDKQDATLTEAQVVKLKQLIARQVPLLDEAIRLHRDRVADVMRPQHEHLELSYDRLKHHILTNYSSYLPSNYSNRLTIRSYRSRNRSPIRFLRSELRLLDSTNGTYWNDTHTLKRFSDAGQRSTRNMSVGSNTGSAASPIISGSFPYHQLGSERSPVRAEPAARRNLGSISPAGRPDRRLSTPILSNIYHSAPIAAPRALQKQTREADQESQSNGDCVESIIIPVPPRARLYSENSASKKGGGDDRCLVCDTPSHSDDQSSSDQRSQESSETNLVSF